MNNSMTEIPTSHHLQPDGGAIEVMTQMLEDRKKYGVQRLGHECQKERNRKGHKYVHKFPCEAIKPPNHKPPKKEKGGKGNKNSNKKI